MAIPAAVQVGGLASAYARARFDASSTQEKNQ
jgi:hypothetical protein